MVCLCRGGPTCCRVLAQQRHWDVCWDSMARWSADQFWQSWRRSEADAERERQEAEYQGA